MKPTYALLPDFVTDSKPFVLQEIVRPAFSTDFHFHQECQLVCVLEGTGNRIIGGSAEPFAPGDITFIGPNLPHVWYSDRQLNTVPPLARSLALYIQPATVLEHLSAFVNPQAVTDFFRRSERGLTVTGATRELIAAALLRMQAETGLPLLLSFLSILQHLLNPADVRWLNDDHPMAQYTNSGQERIPRLMGYVREHFRSEVSLTMAASVAGLEVHSFCRYFKSLTQRTFSDFVSELRVSFACQLLQQTDLSITQVAYESGFANLSYFNRSFKRIRGVTPKIYRQRWQSLAG